MYREESLSRRRGRVGESGRGRECLSKRAVRSASAVGEERSGSEVARAVSMVGMNSNRWNGLMKSSNGGPAGRLTSVVLRSSETRVAMLESILSVILINSSRSVNAL